MRNIIKHIPNGITLLNLFAGVLSVAFASIGNFYFASLLILIAALLDFLDGFLARLLQAYSPIGKELDSMADIISFGFAPAFMMYIYLKKILLSNYLTADILYAPVSELLMILSPFLLTAFAALRLAKFNVTTTQKTFFLGLPTPAMALFFASAMLSFNTPWLNDVSIYAWHWVVLIVVFSSLMVIPLHMFSLKFSSFGWHSNEIRYIFIGISLILLVTLQSLGLSIAIVLYIFLSGVTNIMDLNY